jgi:hypothetical protein
MLQKICLLEHGFGMRYRERELEEILKIFSKYHNIDSIVAINKKKKVKECNR